MRQLRESEARPTEKRASLLFVLGFSMVFVAVGLTASYLGYLLLRNQDTVTRALGVVVIVLGLASAGVLRIPFLNRERRFDMAKIPRGPAWAVPTGMAFAAGWTPCLGPTLGTILTAAAAEAPPPWAPACCSSTPSVLGSPSSPSPSATSASKARSASSNATAEPVDCATRQPVVVGLVESSRESG